MRETSFSYCDKDMAFFSSDERKWINKIRRLPVESMKINLIPRRQLSDEERAVAAERLKLARKARKEV